MLKNEPPREASALLLNPEPVIVMSKGAHGGYDSVTDKDVSVAAAGSSVAKRNRVSVALIGLEISMDRVTLQGREPSIV